MLLKNGKNYFSARNTSNNFQIKPSQGGNVQNEYMPNVAYSCVDVGSNTTAPTTSDYSIAGVSGLSMVANTSSFNDGLNWDADYYASFSTTYKNITEEDITINEYAVCFYNTYREGYFHWYITRDVLEEPKVIHPGESYTFSVTVG